MHQQDSNVVGKAARKSSPNKASWLGWGVHELSSQVLTQSLANKACRPELQLLETARINSVEFCTTMVSTSMLDPKSCSITASDVQHSVLSTYQSCCFWPCLAAKTILPSNSPKECADMRPGETFSGASKLLKLAIISSSLELKRSRPALTCCITCWVVAAAWRSWSSGDRVTSVLQALTVIRLPKAKTCDATSNQCALHSLVMSVWPRLAATPRVTTHQAKSSIKHRCHEYAKVNKTSATATPWPNTLVPTGTDPFMAQPQQPWAHLRKT